MNKSNIELTNINIIDENYKVLFDSINKEKVNNAQKYAKILIEKKIQITKDKVKTFKRIALTSFFGLIPVLDLFIESKMKKNVQKEIAEDLNDDLINLNDNNFTISEEEQSFIDIENFKKETSDKSTDIIKTISKAGAWLFCGLSKFAKLWRYGSAIVGSVVGAVVSPIVMNYDINKYLDFYGKRLLYRYLVNLSFNKIEKYLKNKFENQEHLNNEINNVNFL